MIRRVVFASILGSLVAAVAEAQVPPAVMPPAANPPADLKPSATVASTTPALPKRQLSDTPPPLPTPAVLPDRPANNRPVAAPAQQNAAAGRAHPGAGNNGDPLSARGRFANPGGVGRYSEYYTPFTPMYGYPGPSRSHVAVFGQGGGPTRADQIEAFRAGQYRAQNIQNNINAYGRPLGFGYGIGIGGYGGYR
jgi:hypothetical protein